MGTLIELSGNQEQSQHPYEEWRGTILFQCFVGCDMSCFYMILAKR